jgi:trigger factor
MAYELIKEDGARRIIQFRMDASELNAIFRKIKKDISKEARIPGFRAGHVPDSILEKRFSSLIVSEAAEKAHKQLAAGLFDDFDWVLADSDPEFDNQLPVEGEDYVYTVTYTVFETPEPVDYRGIKLVVPPYSPEKAVLDTLQHIRTQYVSYDETDLPSAENDLVVLTYPDLKGDGSSEPRVFTAVIGHNDMGPGFDELITGVKAGDSFTMQMKVSGSGDDDGLKGSAHTFTVKAVKAHSYPELDDDFAMKSGGYSTIEELRQKIYADVTRSYETDYRSFTEDQAIDCLLKTNVFEVPAFMVENLTQDFISRLPDKDNSDEASRKTAREMAERKVREFLILREIAIKENLDVAGQEIEDDVDGKAAALDSSRNEKALKFVIDSAVIEEKGIEEQNREAEEMHGVSWRWVSVEPSEAVAGSEGVE